MKQNYYHIARDFCHTNFNSSYDVMYVCTTSLFNKNKQTFKQYNNGYLHFVLFTLSMGLEIIGKMFHFNILY